MKEVSLCCTSWNMPTSWAKFNTNGHHGFNAFRGQDSHAILEALQDWMIHMKESRLLIATDSTKLCLSVRLDLLTTPCLDVDQVTRTVS